jgi:hypothetical protein
MTKRDWTRIRPPKPTEAQGDDQLRAFASRPRFAKSDRNKPKLRAKLNDAVREYLEKGGRIKVLK